MTESTDITAPKTVDNKLLVTDPPAAPLATIATNPLVVLEAALQTGRTADELKQLYEFYRLVKSDEAKAAYDAAFLAFQEECEPLPRTGTADEVTSGGTSVKFTFCTLSDLDTALPLLRKHGFTREFGSLQIDAAKATMEGTITHKGGHSVTKTADMPTGSNFLKNQQNQVMGATSYLKRLLFSNMLGVPVNDLENRPPREPAEPVETITEEQQHALNDLLIQVTDGDEDAIKRWKARLLKAVGVKSDSLGDFPASKLDEYTKLVVDQIEANRKDGT